MGFSYGKSRMFGLTLSNAAGLVLAIAVTAARAADSAPSAGDAALFDRLDANHDGVVSASEVTAENRFLFERLVRRSDANHDNSLSREEFTSSLTPTRAEKPIDEMNTASDEANANAVRYMLLSMDKNRNARIEKDEIPRDAKFLDMLVERMDKNGNGALERQELSRGGPGLGGIAARYVAREGIDVDAELAKLKKSEGEAYGRFEQQPKPLADIRDPKQAKQLFAQFDENADGKLEAKEVPDPLQEPIGRLVRIGDRNGDGKLTEDEFVKATEQLSRLMKRGGPEGGPFRERMMERMREKDTKPKSNDNRSAKN